MNRQLLFLVAALFAPLISLQAQCLLNPFVSNTVCDDNGTDAESGDDTYTFDLTVFADSLSQGSDSWVADDPDGTTGDYGAPVAFGPFAIADGPLTITVTDGADPNCIVQITVTPPAPCSFVCTTDAGTMDPEPISVCGDETITIPHNGDATLDGDDALVYVFHDSPDGTLGSIFDSTSNQVYDLSTGQISQFGANTQLYVSAVAGNSAGVWGGINLQDPCLSVAPGTPIFVSNPLPDTCNVGQLDCNDTTVDLDCAVTGVGPLTYQWLDPTGAVISTDAPVTVNVPGDYTLSMTDGNDCTNEVVFPVVDNTDPPFLTIGTAGSLSCQDTMALVAEGDTGPGYTYEWSTGATSNFLTIQEPGEYCVTVTAPSGCASEDCFTVDENTADPLAVTIEGNLVLPCDGSSNTLLTVNVTGGTPPYEYDWWVGETTQDIIVDEPGLYTVVVTDQEGCFAMATAEVTLDLVADAGPNQTIDCVNPTVTLGSSNTTTGPDITYEWTGPLGFNADELFVEVSTPGFYSLSVSNGECLVDDFVFVNTLLDSVNIGLNYEIVSCSEAELIHFVPPTQQNFSAEWELPDGSTSAENPLTTEQAGWHFLIISDNFSDCVLTDSVFIDIDPEGCAQLDGTVFLDDGDCTYAGTEMALADWIVQVQTGGETFFTTTDADGYYEFGVFPGEVIVSVVPPNPLWMGCQAAYTINLPDPETSATINIPMDVVEDCPYLTVDIGTPFLRRCFDNDYFVDYCNDGTAAAEDAFVTIDLDPFMTFVASVLPVEVDGNQLTFQLGDLPVGECGTFYFTVNINCDAVLGQTHCVEANIFPQDDCLPSNPNWSGASLAISGECDEVAGLARFSIENTGTGDMQQPAPYIVIEDGVMLMNGDGGIQLNSGEGYDLEYPANGSTYRVEVDQVPFHPGQSMPSFALEGCGTNGQSSFSTGFVTQFPLNDANSFFDIDCQQNIGAFDPNDKQAYPVGYADERFIEANTDLEYYIRFQNTGTDTAFNVVIRDTLASELDVASVVPGASSHHYEWTLEKRNVLIFSFENILLPDSSTNLEGSQGFVKFRISQQPDLPGGAQINNSAAIFFDFNEPIITNTVSHTIGEEFVVTEVETVSLESIQLHAAPNPADHVAYLRLEGWNGDEVQFTLFDETGRVLRSDTFRGDTFTFHRNGLPAGFYFFRLESRGMGLGQGKLILR